MSSNFFEADAKPLTSPFFEADAKPSTSFFEEDARPATSSFFEEDAKPAETYSQGESALWGGLQGATFNFADEIEAAVRSLAPGETYEDAVAKVRARYKAAEEANPKTFLASNVGAGLVTGLVPVVGQVGRGASIAQAAKVGAAGGALAGFGGGEGAEESLKEAAIGGGVGAVLGAGIQKLTGKGALAEKAIEDAVTPEGAPKAVKDIYDAVEKAYAPKLEYYENFAKQLYNGESIEVAEEMKDKVIFFAKRLDGGEHNITDVDSAIDALSIAKTRLSEEDFVLSYHDAAKVDLMKNMVDLEVGPESAYAKTLRSSINSVIDGSYAARNIDQRHGTALQDILLRGSKATSLYMQDLVKSLERAKPLIDKTDVESYPKLYRALDTGKLEGLTPEEKTLVEGWKAFFKREAEELRKLGIPIKDKDNYVPHKMVEPAHAIRAIQRKVEEFGGIERVALTKPKELVDTVLYLTGHVPEDPREFAKALRTVMTPGGKGWNSERIASALFKREDVLPDFLKEKDLRRLTHKYSMEGYRYARTKDILRELNYNKELLTAANAGKDASFIDNLVHDFLGGQRGLAGFTRDAMTSMQVKALEKADRTTSPIAKKFYEGVADSPEAIRNAFMNVYPNFLGLSPKAAIQNLTGSFFTTVPELGYTYGTKNFFGAYREALANIASNRGDYFAKMEAKGLISPQWSTDLLETFSKTKKGPLGRGLEKSAQISMKVFEASEKLNRAVLYEMGKRLAKDSSSKEAQAFFQTMTPFMQRKLATLQGEAKEDFIVRYIADRALFSYNRLNQSELSRAVGPLFSMFTKYPMAVAGRTMEKYRTEGTAAGLMDTGKYLAGPYLAATVLNYAMREGGMEPEWEGRIFGKPKGALMGEGLAAGSPVGAIQGILEGRTFKSPALGVVSDVAGGALAGDMDKLERGITNTAKAFAPGGVSAYYKTLEEGLRIVDILGDDESLIGGR